MLQRNVFFFPNNTICSAYYCEWQDQRNRQKWFINAVNKYYLYTKRRLKPYKGNKNCRYPWQTHSNDISALSECSVAKRPTNSVHPLQRNHSKCKDWCQHDHDVPNVACNNKSLRNILDCILCNEKWDLNCSCHEIDHSQTKHAEENWIACEVCVWKILLLWGCLRRL